MPNQPAQSITVLKRYEWSQLTRQQVGRYAEYFVKMEFTMFGFDVYSSEVDDKGIDFVVRKHPSRYYDIQVKSLRRKGYVFMEKTKFELRDNLYLALVLFMEGKMPDLYLIPSTAWRNPTTLFASRDYPGLKSHPEWGLNVSIKHMPILQPFRYDLMLPKL